MENFSWNDLVTHQKLCRKRLRKAKTLLRKKEKKYYVTNLNFFEKTTNVE